MSSVNVITNGECRDKITQHAEPASLLLCAVFQSEQLSVRSVDVSSRALRDVSFDV